MHIGKMRPARAGEVPTHYAIEDIKAGEPVVDMEFRKFQENMRNMMADNMERSAKRMFVPRGVGKEVTIEVELHGHRIGRSLRPHDDMVDAMLYSMLPSAEKARREQARREKRSDRIWMWVILSIGVPLLLFMAYRLHQSVMAFISS